ncbi:MAG: LAGLIDADG family homing endonuclease [Candidatus Diapherotrites archaeon]
MLFSEKHAEFVGLHFGDGSLTRRPGKNTLRFQLRGDAKTDRAHYEQFIIPLCNELIGFPLLGRPLSTIHDKKLNSFGIALETDKIERFFTELGVPIGIKEELPIPNWILENENYSKAFVRGLFDTDGTISFKRNNTCPGRIPRVSYINIVSVSKTLIQDVSEILAKARVKHYVRKYSSKVGDKDSFKIEIYRPHTNEFMKKIGSHNPKHLSKFEIYCRFGFCPTHTTPQQREDILKGILDPYTLVAGVAKRSNVPA